MWREGRREVWERSSLQNNGINLAKDCAADGSPTCLTVMLMIVSRGVAWAAWQESGRWRGRQIWA